MRLAKLALAAILLALAAVSAADTVSYFSSRAVHLLPPP